MAGARELYSYCERRVDPARALRQADRRASRGELAALDELERRGRENGVTGLRRLNADELSEVEPHARGVAALDSPDTGIVDFAAVARALAAGLRRARRGRGHRCAVETVESGRRRARHARGETRARFAVFCAGAGPTGSPWRRAPRRIRASCRSGAAICTCGPSARTSSGLIYPVPDPALPFLGVHLSRHVDGHVSLGPSALLGRATPGDSLWPGTCGWRGAGGAPA